MDWQETRQSLQRRLEELRDERAAFVPLWRELSDHVLPYRGRFLGRDERPNDGRRRDEHIIDGKATHALRILAAGMQGGLTSPARPWFRLATPDPEMMEYGPVRTWLGEVEALFRDIFARSNVYNALHGTYVELGLFGTACLILHKDFHDVVRARPLTVSEAMFDQGPRMTVDTLYRECKMTVRQLVEQFGLDSVSPRTRHLYDTGAPGAWIDVVHVIEPAPDKGRRHAGAKPWREIYWEVGGDGDGPLAVSGYDEFPAMVPRWDVVGADVYGRSPGMEALADIKMLQTLQTRVLQAIDKNTNPPLVAPAAMKGQVVNALPGGVNFVVPGQGPTTIQPLYQPNLPIKELEYKIERVQQAVSEGFYADLFLMLARSDHPQITAAEVAERHEEKLMMIGPVLERLQHELLNPLIERTFSIAARAGILPPTPRELKGRELKVEYISLLAQAQKMVGTEAVQRFTGYVGSLAALKPDIVDKIDFDQIADELADALGVPPKIVRPDSAVKKLRATAKPEAPAANPLAGIMQTLEPLLSGGGAAASGTAPQSNPQLAAMLSQMVGRALPPAAGGER